MMSQKQVSEADDQPFWFTDDYFQHLLRREDKNPTLRVRIKDVSLASSSGENYSGLLHRVTLAVSPSEEVSLVVKTMPRSELMQKIMEIGGTFRKETLMYKETLPRMYHLGGGRCGTISPRYYDSLIDNTLILEDLRATGHVMGDRREGLDRDHCLTAVRTLARFHALSVALYQRDPDSMTPYLEAPITEQHREYMKPFTETRLHRLAASVELWPGYERFGVILRELSHRVFDKMLELTKERPGNFLVLTHSDLWVNNMMFRYTPDGRVAEVKFLDFQMCRYASPALDLQHFFCTSPDLEVRERYIEELMRSYHRELCEVMITLGCGSKVISLDDLKRQMKEKVFYSVFVGTALLSVIMANPDDAPDFGDTSELSKDGTNAQARASARDNNPKFREIFQRMLILFESRGYI